MELKPLTATRTGVEVAEDLRAQIQAGEIAVGVRLPPQRTLATTLSVGRHAVAEALSLLEAEGYVVTRRGAHGGSFVCEPVRPASVWLQQVRDSFADLVDTLDFRLGVESEIARLAAVRRTTADIAEMQSAIDALPTHEVTRSDFREADGRFHAGLSRAARNDRLAAALRRARADVFIPTDNIPFVETVDVSRRQHQQILLAVADGDEAGAADAVRGHIEETRRHLRALVDGDAL